MWFRDFLKQGRRPDWEELADIDEVLRRRRALKARYPELTRAERDAKDRELVAPDGPLARSLDALGVRPLTSAVVGETP